MQIWGWQSPAELLWLGEQAAKMESVVEVGVLRGRSSFALLTACPGPVYCIDPWHDPGDHAYTGFMEACGHFPNLRAIRGWSPAAGVHVPGGIDMVFLDGSHDYDSVMADLSEWLPRTRRLICGHDFSYPGGYPAGHVYDGCEAYPGVHQAVEATFGCGYELVPDTAIWAVWL